MNGLASAARRARDRRLHFLVLDIPARSRPRDGQIRSLRGARRCRPQVRRSGRDRPRNGGRIVLSLLTIPRPRSCLQASWGGLIALKEGDMAEQRVPALVRGSQPATEEGLSADAFRGLELALKDAKAKRAADAEAAAVVQRRERVKALIDEQIDDAEWQQLLHQAREAAEHGEKEYLLLRFRARYAPTMRAQSTISQMSIGPRPFGVRRLRSTLAGAIN